MHIWKRIDWIIIFFNLKQFFLVCINLIYFEYLQIWWEILIWIKLVGLSDCNLFFSNKQDGVLWCIEVSSSLSLLFTMEFWSILLVILQFKIVFCLRSLRSTEVKFYVIQSVLHWFTMPHTIWTKVGNSSHSVTPPTHRPYTGCGRGCYRQASLTSSTTFAPKMFWVCHIIISPLACELTYLLTQESAPPKRAPYL